MSAEKNRKVFYLKVPKYKIQMMKICGLKFLYSLRKKFTYK